MAPRPISIMPLLQGSLSLMLLSFLMALIVVAWETVVSDYALPSRQTRSAVVQLQRLQLQHPQSQWGKVTVRGLGFGQSDRELLLQQQQQQQIENENEKNDPPPPSLSSTMLLLPSRPSYNEVMLQHRRDRVPYWKSLSTDSNSRDNYYPTATAADGLQELSSSSSSHYSSAIHSVLSALESIPNLQTLARDFQWEDLRSILRSSLWQDELNQAAALLHHYLDTHTTSATNYYSSTPSDRGSGSGSGGGSAGSGSGMAMVVGFDWGSCAWRSACGAWADWQESIDQMDAMLGLLEPNEVLFCLDIVERSLRDVLAEAASSYNKEASSTTASGDSGSIISTSSTPSYYKNNNNMLWDRDDWNRYQHIPAYQPYHQYRHSSLSTAAAEDATPEEEEDVEDDEDPYLQALRQFRVD